MVKNPLAKARDVGDASSIPGKIPWRRAWQPTPVFLLGESHAQRSLVGYSPWRCKELDTTEVTACIHTVICRVNALTSLKVYTKMSLSH